MRLDKRRERAVLFCYIYMFDVIESKVVIRGFAGDNFAKKKKKS